MNRWNIALLSACVLAILALLFWEYEYQHISLLLWLLVAIALLWSCAWVTVSLRITPYQRRRQARLAQTSVQSPVQSQMPTPTRRRRPGTSSSIALSIALVLMALGLIFWLLGFENTGQLIGFLVIVALLWACVELSLYLSPSRRFRARPQQVAVPYDEPLFPGSTLRTGFYNEHNKKVWDGNESLPPSEI